MKDEYIYQALAELIARAPEMAQEIESLRAENERLREGMKGDYDLDAWLDWAAEAKQLRAEVEALRECLVKFTQECERDSCVDGTDYGWSKAMECGSCKRIAEAKALLSTQEQEKDDE